MKVKSEEAVAGKNDPKAIAPLAKYSGLQIEITYIKDWRSERLCGRKQA
ncbi:hypothetical protein H6G20_12495 [Desertifilum sp. FACHB-1129]|nr:hypothetical protein [Desertifilum sp. FACHB-1129]